MAAALLCHGCQGGSLVGPEDGATPDAGRARDRGATADRERPRDAGEGRDARAKVDRPRPADLGEPADKAPPPTDKKPPPPDKLQPKPDQKPPPPCSSYTSGGAEVAPVQTTGNKLPSGKLLPPGYTKLKWSKPTQKPDYSVPFSGTPGLKAKHEGLDLVIGKTGPTSVPVRAIADGVVVYVRLGCPQKCAGDPAGMFCKNTAVRECGAGWGNHLVLAHAGGILSRYAHLKHGSIPAAALVGKAVKRGQHIALMGNSGRSELRHLHLELGVRKQPFDPCAKSRSFDLIYDPGQLPW